MSPPSRLAAALDRPRIVLFVLATICFLAAVGLQAGASGLADLIAGAAGDATSDLAASEVIASLDEDLRDDAREDFDRLSGQDDPPGVGTLALLAVDAWLAFGILTRLLSLWLDRAVVGRIALIVRIILALLLIVAELLALLGLIMLLLVMVSMFLAAPFGTIAYLAIWGGFDVGGAGAVLAAIILLKLAALVLLVLHHPRTVLRQRALLIWWLLSLGLTMLLVFLHGVVPSILASITDVVGGIVFVIVGLIMSVLWLIGGILGIVNEIRAGAARVA